MESAPYIPPTVTVDGIVFQILDDTLGVLLIKRTNEPFKDEWALPGGYNARGETTTEALGRVLRQKAGIGIKQLAVVEQLYTFDAIARDPRGHAVSVTYMCLGGGIIPNEIDSQQPQFFSVTDLPELAYDHTGIITYAHERLKAKLMYTNIAFALLPNMFTLSQLQDVYEAVLGRLLDKRNFRKKFLALELIQETKGLSQGGAHRPARLYEFRTRTLQELGRSFE
jgi:8-oxo-dGTP diphosphatase